MNGGRDKEPLNRDIMNKVRGLFFGFYPSDEEKNHRSCVNAINSFLRGERKTQTGNHNFSSLNTVSFLLKNGLCCWSLWLEEPYRASTLDLIGTIGQVKPIRSL